MLIPSETPSGFHLRWNKFFNWDETLLFWRDISCKGQNAALHSSSLFDLRKHVIAEFLIVSLEKTCQKRRSAFMRFLVFWSRDEALDLDFDILLRIFSCFTCFDLHRGKLELVKKPPQTYSPSQPLLGSSRNAPGQLTAAHSSSAFLSFCHWEPITCM